MATPMSHHAPTVVSATKRYATPQAAEGDEEIQSHTQDLDTSMSRARKRTLNNGRHITDKDGQVLTFSRVKAMSSRDIYDALGLASISGTGRIYSAHRDTARMLAFNTGVAPKLALPLDWIEAINLLEDQAYLNLLEEQVAAILSKFGYIWERGVRRSSKSDLYSDVEEDLSSIKRGLKAFVVKRAFHPRQNVMRRARSEAVNTIGGSEDDGDDTLSNSTPDSSCNDPSPSLIEPDSAISHNRRTIFHHNSGTGSLSIASTTLASFRSTITEDDSSAAAHNSTPSSNPEFATAIGASTNVLFSPTSPSVKGEGEAQGEITREKVWILQQTAFDQLLAIRQASNTQDASFMPFDNHVRDVHCPMVHERMELSLGNRRLGNAVGAYKLWSRMHEELRQFRLATKYKGKADGWATHKQTLRGVSWKVAYVPALNAHCQLGLFVMEIKKREVWLQTEDDFAAQLADIMVRCWMLRLCSPKIWWMGSKSTTSSCWLGSNFSWLRIC
ncbi:hypothetical protein BKA63DRAFT_213836 [Paraphoma chrysanthemicola]|nr:hypothetical protein BKA63DRAFT_213836 [Paraphoma chrysanthemicola]